MEEPSDGLREKQKHGKRQQKRDNFGPWEWIDGP